MPDYNFEFERERRRNARWNTFYILIAFVIIAYIAANFNEYKAAVMGPDEKKYIVQENMVIVNTGILKIHDFRNNVVFESNDTKLTIEILKGKGGFLVKDNQDKTIGAFLGDGWYSLEVTDKAEELKSGEITENVEQTN